MSFRCKALVFILIIFFSSNILQAQKNPDIEWYESFFKGPDDRAEQKISAATLDLQEAVETHDLAREARAGKTLGLLHTTHTHDYDTAIIFLIDALAIEDSLDLKQQQIYTCLGIASVFESVGNFPKSAEYLELAMEINRPFNDTEVLVMILNKLGQVNAARRHIDAAFENYELVLKYEGEIENPAVRAEALFNIGHLYRIQERYGKSLEYHKEALQIRRSIRDKKNEAISLNDIGEVYRMMKNTEKAMANHLVALDIRRQLKDDAALSESYNNIGALYFFQGNFERAIANLELGLNAARSSQAQNQVMKSAEYLSFCYRELGNFQKALEYRELFIGINELLNNEKNEQRLLDVQNQYELGKKQNEISRLEKIRVQREQQLKAEQRYRQFLFVFLGLVLVIVVLVLYMYISKRRSNVILKAANDKVQQQNLELQDLNATKDKFFSIISHDLKGPLNSLTSFSSLLINHTDSLSKEEITMLAKDLDKSVKNLFALLENLLEWSRSQTGNIEFKAESFDVNQLLEINRDLLKAQAGNKKISIENKYGKPVFTMSHKHSVNTVIRNLISNAIKFTPENGAITLDVKSMKDDLVISVNDNGVGMSKEVLDKLFRIDTKHSTRGTSDEKGTGLGLILCKEFIEKNGGKIWVESEVGKGSTFYFSLKASTQVPVQHSQKVQVPS